MKLLILGGTRFLGRHLVETALSQGHEVTLFNRGQTNPELFPHTEKFRGNRDGDFQALNGRHWDAVIDTSGYVSTKVQAMAQRLADSVSHYTFISSISVYSDFSKTGITESATLAELPRGTREDEKDSESYGARKALCEQALDRILPGRALKIRPGIIVGPHDFSGRFTYWVQRVAQGGPVLAPGDPDTPVQLIDARDLASWTIQMVQQRQTGTFNTTGPAEKLTFEQMLKCCRDASGSDARFVWLNEEFLLEQQVAPFSDLPFWIPKKEKAYAGHFAVDSRKAFNSGLTCRPLEQTARDTLNWMLAGAVQTSVGLQPERERQLLKASMDPIVSGQ